MRFNGSLHLLQSHALPFGAAYLLPVYSVEDDRVDRGYYIAFCKWICGFFFIVLEVALIIEDILSLLVWQDAVTCLRGSRPNIHKKLVRV